MVCTTRKRSLSRRVPAQLRTPKLSNARISSWAPSFVCRQLAPGQTRISPESCIAKHECAEVGLYDRPMDARPIGVFDSGAGGLTVLHECLVTLPHEDFVYLGDGARLPYGPRPLDEIRRFAGEIAGYLERQGIKLVVAACNSATAAALPDIQRALSVPVLGVIQPEAHAAVRATRNRRVGLLATEATVASGRYEALIWTLDAGVT